MKAPELKTLLKTAIRKGWAILMRSVPGCGKSDCADQAVIELNNEGFDCEMAIEHPVVSDPTDPKGLPYAEKRIVNGKEITEANFLPYGNLRRMMEATKPLVVFLDDLGQASPAVQASYMQLLLAREINGKRISDHVRFIAATNGKQDGAGVSGLITPLINRFRSVVTLDCDASAWIQWAIKNGMPLELMAYMQFKPDAITSFDPTKAKDMTAFASPRSWAFLGEWFNAGVKDLETWSGCVGIGQATGFHGFCSIFNDVKNLIPAILTNPNAAPIPAEPDRLFAVCASLSYQASKKNIDAIAQYMERLDEMQSMFFWVTAPSRKPEIMESNAFTKWSIAHQDLIK